MVTTNFVTVLVCNPEVHPYRSSVIRNILDPTRSVLKTLYFKLIYPSVMDPPGILMLQYVRNVFEKLGLQPESIKFKKEKFNSDNLIKALTENPKKCPAIAADKWIASEKIGKKWIDEHWEGGHCMVATNALKGEELGMKVLKDKWFIHCKNSYRDKKKEQELFEIFLRL